MKNPTPTMTADSSSGLDERSLQLRRLVLRALTAADKGHVGSALSLIEILRVLYDHIVKHDPKRPTWDDRDRVILSKGHGCLALYALLADQGYFPHETLDRFCEWGSPLGGHPERDLELGFEASTGALGHGLPFGVGMALANRRRGKTSRVFVVVGDGELNEGSCWEALLLACKHRLSNLTVIVDRNAQQQCGPCDAVLPMEPLRSKFASFGADAIEVDGHSTDLLLDAFRWATSQKSGPPHVVICQTVKGKGIPVAEHNAEWHYRRGIGEEMIAQIAERWAAKS
jgi:transketolase